VAAHNLMNSGLCTLSTRPDTPPTDTHTGRARTAQPWSPTAPRAPWPPQWRTHVPSRAPTSLEPLEPAQELAEACTVHSLLQSSHTGKEGEKKGLEDRVLCGSRTSHTLTIAPCVASSHHDKHMRQKNATVSPKPLWRRADGALSAAASPMVARAPSKARERAILRLPRPSRVQSAAYI
jgi:hypothetical protein